MQGAFFARNFSLRLKFAQYKYLGGFFYVKHADAYESEKKLFVNNFCYPLRIH